MAKRNTQQMIDELNKKYGVTSTVTTNNGNKEKQSSSASPSIKKDSGKKTKTERTQSAIDSLNKKYGIGTTTSPSLKSSIPSSTSTPSSTKKYSNYSSTVKHLQDRGVKGASGIMTETEWKRRNRNGGSYQDYLDNEVGKYGIGNINLADRPIYKNPDGTISTVASTSFETDGRHIVVPTIIRDEKGNAKKLTADEAWEHYKKTGEYLGEFDNKADADTFSQNLHESQAKYYEGVNEKKIQELQTKILTNELKYNDDYWLSVHDEAVSRFRKEGKWDSVKIENRAWAAVEELKKAWKEEKEEIEDEIRRLSGVRDATWKDAFIGSFKRGYHNSRSGDAAFDKMFGKENDADEINKLLQSEEYMFEADGTAKEAVSGAAEMLGQQLYYLSQPKTLNTVIGSTAAGAGTAFVAGQMGPQVLAPEEAVTVPAGALLGFKTGMTLAATENALRIEAGHAYNEMIENGISHETARNIALAVGGINATLEALQTDKLLNAYKVLGKSGTTRSAAKVILAELVERGIDVGVETTQEVMQEGTTMAGVSLGNRIDKGEWLYTAEEVGERLKDTAESSMLTFGAMNVPAVVTNVVSTGHKVKNAPVEYAKDNKIILDGLIKEGKDIGGDSAKIATQIETKLKNGKKVSTGEVKSLINATEKVKKAEAKTTKSTPSTPRKITTMSGIQALESRRQGKVSEEMLETLTLNDIDITAEEVKEVTGFGDKGSEYIANKANVSGVTFSQALYEVRDAYLDGYTNAKSDNMKSNAYTAGQMDRQTSLNMKKQNAQNVVVHKDAGFSLENLPDDVTQRESAIVDRIMSSLGTRGYMTTGLEGNAEYNRATGEVPIDKTFQRQANREQVSVVYHAAHEGLHRVVHLAPEEGSAFVYEMYKHLSNNNQIPLADIKRKSYARQGGDIDFDMAMEEVSANSVLYLYNGNEANFKKAIDSIANGTNTKAKQGLRRFIDYLNRIIRNLRDIIAGKSARERAKIQHDLKEISRLRDMFETAYAKAVENKKAIESRSSDTKSTKNLEIKTNEEYNGNVNHSLKDKETTYNEKDYRNFGWARANGILNEGQNADYRSKFADAKVGRAKFNKTKKGEYIIPVSDIYDADAEGIDNVLVFAKGTITNPVITSVIEIYENNETILSDVRGYIYDCERRGIHQETGASFGRYYATDFEFSQTRQESVLSGFENSEDNTIKGGNSRADSAIDKEIGRVDHSLKDSEGNALTEEQREFADSNISYSLREEAPPKNTILGYKVFVVKNGKLYPPMVANPNGEHTPVGVWLNADIGASAPDSKTGRKQVKAGGKGTQGGSGSLAFRPGWHLGEMPLAIQFNRLNPETGIKELFPENFVWAECEVAADVDYQDEAMSYGYTENGKFRHSYAGLPRLPVDGYYKYRTNPNPETVPWIISGAIKVNRVLSDKEVAKILSDNNIEAPKRQGGEKTLNELGLDTDINHSLKENTENLSTEDKNVVDELGEGAKFVTNDNGDMLIATNKDKSTVMYSRKTYDEGGREALAKALADNGHTTEEINETLSWVDDAADYLTILAAGYAKTHNYNALSDHLIADVITNVKTGKQVISSIVNNGDYPVNIDLALICKKRVAYMNLMNRLIDDGIFDKVNYGGEAIAKVNQLLRADGFETACLGCFVESRRLQFQSWAETIVSEWNAEVDKRTKGAENFNFADGKANLTDAEMDALAEELKNAGKKNAQGNLNLGQGSVQTRMGRLLDKVPSLRKHLTVADLLKPEGLTALRGYDSNLFSLVKSRYGAASPKIVQDYNPYAGEIAMMTFSSVKNITSKAIKGADAYRRKVRAEMGGTPVKQKGETVETFKTRKAEFNTKVEDETMRRYLYDIGGARIQSFSDFMIENVFDYIQIFADLSAKRLPLHGYTKEIVALRLFGMTGAKWNGSWIAHTDRSMGREYAGLLPASEAKNGNAILVHTEDGDFAIGFDDYDRYKASNKKTFIQSIGMKDMVALQLDPRYSPYVGSITIGVSDKQILAMLDSPLFRFVIPYHSSGMLPQFAKLVGVDMYNDYTDYQNTSVKKWFDAYGNPCNPIKDSKGDVIKVDTSYNFNAEVQKTGDAKKAADNYLKWCDRKHPVYKDKKLVGYTTFKPKFSDSPFGTDFSKHENYYKLLEDFNVYDNITEESAVQGAVTMTFPSENNRLSASEMEAYKERLRETGIFTEKEIEKYSKIADKTFKELVADEVKGRAEYQKAQEPKWETTVQNVEQMLLGDHKRDVSHSLKDDTTIPSIEERAGITTAIEDMQNGVKGASQRLSKYVDKGVISTEAYKEMVKKYGAIPKGENPHREVKVPLKTADDKKVSQTVRTILEAKATPDEVLPTIEKMVEDGIFSYDVYTDKQAVKDADDYIEEYGWTESYNDWMKDVEKGVVSKQHTVMGWKIYNNAVNTATTTTSETERRTAMETAISVLDAMVRHQRNAAQALQATRVLKKLSPDTQLYAMQKMVNSLQKDIDAKFGKKGDKNDVAGVATEARNKTGEKMANAYKNSKVSRRGKRVVIEGNMAGEPFVFEYAQKVGESVARALETKRNTTVEEKTFLQHIASQLKRFANEKLPSSQKGKTLTAVEMLRDYIQNQAFYNEAWESAQEELRSKYADDEMFDEFINSGIGMDANINPRNAIFMRALVQSAASSKETKANIIRQSALGVTKIAENISAKLIAETGATGEMAQTIKDASVSYVNSVLTEAVANSETNSEKLVTNAIKGAMKDIGITLSEAVTSGEVESAKKAIIDKLVSKYAFGVAEATHTAEIVANQFDAMSRNFAQNRLQGMFKKRDRKTKSVSEQMRLLGNLGAFDIGSEYNSAAARRIFKSEADLHINEELAQKFLNAKTDEERLDIEIEIYRDIGSQMPSDWLDKWTAWRYIAMLTNLRTHGRNIVGNAGFAPVVIAKDLTATAIESAVYHLGGKKMLRGKALVWGSKKDRALLKAAWGDYKNVADIVSNGGKYNDSSLSNKYIQDGRRIFKGILSPVEWVRRGNSWLLELEDVWFSKPHYAYALAQYCKANNITPEQISRGKAIAPAREYAIKEAQKATYKDTNAFSQKVSELGRSGKNKTSVDKAIGTVVEGVLPFRKTPANILVRGVEYSPIGLIKGLTRDLYLVSKNEMTATEAIDNISAGLTGTGLMCLGILLAAQGLIRGNGADGEDEREFEELMGHQAYSLELPNGKSVTLDWLAPESLPFFTGVNYWETRTGKNKEITFSEILSAVSNISDPMLQMSFLQGLNDIVEGVGYASSNDTSGLIAVLSSATTSYLMQGIPTLFGQIERTGESERMTTYTEKNGFLTKDMQYTLGKASAKIPFWDYNQIPYIDAWGRKEASGSALKRGLNNFLNPAYTSNIETSDMENELLRLFESTGDGGVFPSRADKYFTVDKERKDLTAEEYVRYATLKGEKSLKAVTDLVNSKAYKKLDDEEKAKAIKEAYDYANQKAKQAISNYQPQKWVSKADEFSNVGNYISFKTEVASTKAENDGKIKKEEVVDIILDMAENDSDTWKMYLSEYESKADKYAYKNGIDGDDYMRFLLALKKYDRPNKNGNYGTYTQEEELRAVNSLKGVSKRDREIIYRSQNLPSTYKVK